MNNRKIISVIIPVKNESERLKKCLESIGEVEKKDFEVEIIVIDNGSNDDSVEIARKITQNVYIKSDMTVAGLRNFGSKVGKGEILAFVDADCSVARDWVVNAIHHFSDPNVAIVGYMAFAPIDGNNIQKSWNSFRTRKKGLGAVKWINSMNMFVRKDVFSKFSGFDESLITCEDVDLCYRISKKYKIISDSSIIVFHYGEAKRFRQFFLKELWRGTSNYKGVLNHGLVLEELPSLLVPLFFGTSLVVGVSLLLFSHLIIASLIFICFFPLVFSVYASISARNISYFPYFVILSSLYFSARFFSIFIRVKR